jgi:hypothetical protein
VAWDLYILIFPFDLWGEFFQYFRRYSYVCATLRGES